MTDPSAAHNVIQAPANKVFDLDFFMKELGDGPMRFAPLGERSIDEQISNLTESERACFDAIKLKWKSKESGVVFSDEMYLRFARCSPGKKKFNEKTAWKVMKNYDPRYLTMTASSIEPQLSSKTLFPVPGLKSVEGHDVFYMRPSRFHPKQSATQDIIDNLAYCMQVMTEKEMACTEGIAFMANMADWGFENFSVSYCHKFMMMLQGRVPVRVRLFLIVNPPHWFDVIWNIMKPMLARDFRKKVFMIPASALHEHLMDGFSDFLPDDMEVGKASMQDMVQDFVTYRNFVEQEVCQK